MGYYHLCTDGWKEGMLFEGDAQFASAVTSIALMALDCNVKIYGFVLMPNHVHIILSGTGDECTDAFRLLVRRCSHMRKKAGSTPLPEDYWFKLIPIDSTESFKSHLIYLARNPYEKGLYIPGAYPWASDYLLFNSFGERVRGKKVREMTFSSIKRIADCPKRLPNEWEIHPEFGILPRNFVNIEKAKSLFQSPKNYITRLVKDYETLLNISADLNEELKLNDVEVDDIFFTQLRKLFPGKTAHSLDTNEKYRLASLLYRKYSFTAHQLSKRLRMSEYTITQALNAKENW